MEHILLAVSGMTPQIITETLYGIYRQDPAKYPSRIEVLTTGEGRDRLVKNLLGDDNPLTRLQQDYQLPPITFELADIKVPCGDDGQPLEDVRSEREQEIITDFITRHVRTLTANPELAIHASLAGGRKTMGFALGYAMSLFGRPQDCLSHVLVSDPYERVPDFYYPTPTPIWRADARNEGQHDLSQAEVTLATIPLVLMREEMPTDLIRRDELSYTQTVDRINRANALTFESARITLDFDHMSLWCDDIEVPLKPDCFAFYSWLAQDSKENPGEGVGAPREGMKERELDGRLAAFFRAAIHPSVQIDEKSSLGDLFELATDAVSRMNQREEEHFNAAGIPNDKRIYRNRWLLQENSTTQFLYAEHPPRDLATLLKNHKNLWVRLQKDTNEALTHALGPRLASYYQIVTVSSIKENGQRTPYEFKGLKLQPDHIHFR
ncbi:CRISPR-associated ring nuclease Csm6 [Aeromonas sanarellii]|uniref:CRISPR-associated ring nuclease Csm6 n=1 Tax=Aeromonas sanarellii TaxID=633415 RepID=UPI002DB91C15|nr:CRISPR-associated ring nuclease Csm6 [Aeromonas sanarellii]MEB6605836.1 CRISPR-associated ring nuclease Csm6 [Aeromonas sanarellii]